MAAVLHVIETMGLT
uniref:Uncharacterized protein n=1 Tax=Anguilla anguilla TaxID=7936 RepID=A0A0E9PJA7_ANGAN